jgi:hypothetical protein
MIDLNPELLAAEGGDDCRVSRMNAGRMLLFLAVCGVLVSGPAGRGAESSASVDRPPSIAPDYAGIVIPPNIAPLNFAVKEPGVDFRVEIASRSGKPIQVSSGSGRISIPVRPWRALLGENRGQDLLIVVSAREPSGQWVRYRAITNAISSDEIDSHLAYRRLHPLYTLFGSGNLGIFQRDLETFEESPILEMEDRTGEDGWCMNCHTFLNRDPGTFTFHLRGGEGKAMLLVTNHNVSKVDLTAGYMSWHPGGKLIAFSRNKLSLFFHSLGDTRDVYDEKSDLAIYRVDSNKVDAPPVIARPDRQENWPMWSQDGRFLYFVSAPGLPFEQFKKVRYDLQRVEYDSAIDTWGNPETLLTAEETGRSLVEPRPSPDGRFLVFTMCDYGHFPIYQTNSAQYLMDLKTRKYTRMSLNSGRGDTWHCWSSNSRWLVFSSKRLNRLMARPFFSHIDPEGNSSKPFVLPQEDPLFYDTDLKTYNVPEFVTGPVTVSDRRLFRAVKGGSDLKPGSAAVQSVDQGDEAGPARK